MGLDALLATMERQVANTCDTPCTPREVSAQPAPIKACTLDTSDTLQNGNAGNDNATLAADYEELAKCIIELCQLAGYEDEARERMLDARRNLYPYLYATECAYFRLQVIRAKAGTYWHNDALIVGKG